MELTNDLRILLVGAGGIGCEILKNLVLMNYLHIDVVDMDTIELSNLNRQFLFRKKHVGQSKSVVAVETVLAFCPGRDIRALVADITTFGAEFFRVYSIIFNALDNKMARSYVNRMCVAVNRPLIESGSAGYLGQVCPIIPGQTECYDCTPKPSTKSYPGCTIRNTPSEFIHCVVWAKALFNQLFSKEEDSMNEDNEVSPDQSVEGAENSSKNKISTRKWAEKCEYDGKSIFKKIFNEDINVLLSMSNLWSKRTPPKPINLDSLPEELQTDACSGIVDMRVPKSITELADTFFSSISEIKKHIPLVFDKDNSASLDFVYASANLRAEAFHIPLVSKFEVKSKAGNIIPAIASTNAIVAALAVHQGQSILSSAITRPCCIFAKPKQLVPMDCPVPNMDCFVCGGQLGITVSLNVNKCKLSDLRQFIADRLGSEMIDLILGDGRLLPDDSKSSERLLVDYGIGLGGASLLTAETENDDRIQLIVSPSDQINANTIIIHQSKGIKRKKKSGFDDDELSSS